MIDQNVRKLILKEIQQVLSHPSIELNQSRKPDGSWITDIDYELTNRIESLLSKTFPGIKIVSEEGSHELSFPCFILDPVDGTAGLVSGSGECSLSLAFMPSADVKASEASGFITHLFGDLQVHQDMLTSVKRSLEYDGLVSRSEWKKGLYQEALMDQDRSIEPMGSIALKLAHLVNGDANFVATLRPKSIWDIAAGTILFSKQGGRFFYDGVEETNLHQLIYTKTMVWGKESEKDWLLGSK